MPSDAWGLFRAWSVSLGLCRATGRHGNGGKRPALATDLGNGSGPRQLFVASLQFSLALHLPFWDMEVCAWLCGHYTIFTEGVGKDASGFPLRPVGSGVRVVFKWTKHLAFPTPQPLGQPEKLHFDFCMKHWMKGIHGSKMFREPKDQATVFQTAILTH